MDTEQTDKRMLNQDEAAAYLGLKNPKTLAAWRLRQQGPAYIKLGSHVRYRRDDLDAFLEAARVVPDEVKADRRSVSRLKDTTYRPLDSGADGFGVR